MNRKRRTSKASRSFWQKLDDDQIFFLASGLAFNFLICFIPLILVVLSVLGFFLYSSQEIVGQLRIYLENILPQNSPKITANILKLIRDRKLMGLIGFIGLLWAATRLFSSIRFVLDKTIENINHHGYIKEKLYDIFFVLVSGLLFLFSTILVGFFGLIKSFSEKIGFHFPEILEINWWGRIAGLGGSYLFSVLLFFILYRFLPSRRPNNRVALASSLVVAAFWDTAKYLFRLYVNLINNFTEVYGSLGLLVVFIFWIYYSCLIFVVGGELIWRLEKK